MTFEEIKVDSTNFCCRQPIKINIMKTKALIPQKLSFSMLKKNRTVSFIGLKTSLFSTPYDLSSVFYEK